MLFTSENMACHFSGEYVITPDKEESLTLLYILLMESIKKDLEKGVLQ